ncbi:MAG: dehydrogenase [Helicobacteraceae bacterium]|nr:dehydrogenase [Helicobacteraceae bacterium]
MEQTLSRSNIYALISRLLLIELDETLLEQIKSDENILDFFPNFKEWSKVKELDSKTLIEQFLSPDFTNISLLHLIPYESFYIREDQMIETGGANPVTDMYSAFNFHVDYAKSRVVSSDHIGVELEFMHYLCSAQLKAEEAKDEVAITELKRVQKEFLNKHLLQWAPLYLINFKYEARTPIYHDLGEMALEFILSDNEYLSGEVK